MHDELCRDQDQCFVMTLTTIVQYIPVPGLASGLAAEKGGGGGDNNSSLSISVIIIRYRYSASPIL